MNPLLFEKSLASFRFTACHFSFVVYSTRSRNVIAASGGDLKRKDGMNVPVCRKTLQGKATS
jgi:hypothetical protein